MLPRMDSLSVPPLDLINHYSSTHNLDQDEDALFANQILDMIFTCRPNEKLGFGVRVDETKKYLQINTIDFEGEARRVGLKQGDIILAVNDVDVGNNPLIGLRELKKCKAQTQEAQEFDVRITVCRRMFDHIMVTIKRSGITKCDGKYHFIHLDDDYDSPIFMNQDNDLLLLKANYDVETGESLWTISDQTHNYYIGVSTDLMPPNDSWEPIKNVGKYPSPGLVFYNTEQKLIEIEEAITSDDDDEFIDINYDGVHSQNKRMSRIGMMALNDPSSINHPSVVYEHMNEYSDEEEDDVSWESPISEDVDEWKTKYDELWMRYNESQEMIQILRENVKELNASFYEFWLRDKQQVGVNERLQRTISQQSKELFEQNKAEMKLINRINDKQQGRRSRKKVNTLCDIDLDEMFAMDGTIALEVAECQTMACIESELHPLHEEVTGLINRVRAKTKNDSICSLYDIDVDLLFASADDTNENERNELQDEIHGLNEQISCLYDTHLDLLFDDDVAEDHDELMALRDQIKGLEAENTKISELNEEIQELKQENVEMYVLHHEIYQLKEQQVEDLKQEVAGLRGKYAEMYKVKDEMSDLRQYYQSCRKANQDLVTQVSDLKAENNRIIDSKLQLINSTSDEMGKLKNRINGL